MTSAEFVENALIGSLLNDPGRRQEVPWLQADDFTNPLTRAIWQHLEADRPPRGQPLLDLVELSAALGRESDLHPRLRTPAELATLLLQATTGPTGQTDTATGAPQTLTFGLRSRPGPSEP